MSIKSMFGLEAGANVNKSLRMPRANINFVSSVG
jgi:hypothetical protein